MSTEQELDNETKVVAYMGWGISAQEQIDGLRKERRELKAENAKLKELVHWMYDCMDESCAVQHPYAPTPINYDQLMQAQARACKLGIEV